MSRYSHQQGPQRVLLLRRHVSWHAQAVTALAFSDDGAVLLSGGEDTIACAWLLSDALDASPAQQGGLQGPPTLHTWCAWPAKAYLSQRESPHNLVMRRPGPACRSEHTLSITALRVGVGANPVVATASLDRSCKLWSLAQGARPAWRLGPPAGACYHAVQAFSTLQYCRSPRSCCV